MTEQWKRVAGHDGQYEVSDHGRVRSFKRQSAPGAILKQGWKGDKRYKVVVLSTKGQKEHAKVHRLVLETFVGPCPPSMEGCHNNGINSDNRLSNLRWDTRSGNMFDKARHGTHHNGITKLHPSQVAAIRQDSRLQKEIAAEYGVTQNCISLVKRGATWRVTPSQGVAA